MKEITLTSKLTIYESLNELPKDILNLLEKATTIRKNAYAPYSKFKVGAAISLDNGEIVLGTNQENAAFPSGLCAERVALFQASSLYPEAKITKMVITASETNEKSIPIPPCGSCRQSIAEYEIKQESNIEIYFMGEMGKIYKSDSLENLLPLIFNKKLL